MLIALIISQRMTYPSFPIGGSRNLHSKPVSRLCCNLPSSRAIYSYYKNATVVEANIVLDTRKYTDPQDFIYLQYCNRVF